MTDDSSPIAEPGEKLLFRASWEWALNQNIIAVEWSVAKATDEKTLVTGRGMIGWDAANQKILTTGFDSAGGHSIDTFVEKNGTWYQEGKGG